MATDERFEELFHTIMQYEKEIHRQNQKRIRIGIKCLFWIPMIFLFLLFITDSERVIFLVLWIVSLFVIAVYLIYVEYVDYKMQEKIAEISNQEVKEANVLIGQDMDTIEQNIVSALKQMEEKKEMRVEQAKERVVKHITGQKEFLMERIDKEKEDWDEEHTENHDA